MSEMNTPSIPARIPLGRVLLFGLLAIVLAILANYIVLTLVVNILGLPEFGPLSPVLVIALTAIGVLLASLVFAGVSRTAARPMQTFRTIAVIALVLSLVPNILTMTGLVNVAQLLPFGGAGRNVRAGQGGQRNARQTPQPGVAVAPDGGQPDAQGTPQAGQQRGQGQFRRTGQGQGFAAQRIPTQVSLMLMHLVAFLVTLGVFRRAAGPDDALDL
jgi:hypothetical protein